MHICAKYHVVEVFPFVPVIAIDFFGLKGCLYLINFETFLSRSFTTTWVILILSKKQFVIIIFNFFDIASFKYDNLKFLYLFTTKRVFSLTVFEWSVIYSIVILGSLPTIHIIFLCLL